MWNILRLTARPGQHSSLIHKTTSICVLAGWRWGGGRTTCSTCIAKWFTRVRCSSKSDLAHFGGMIFLAFVQPVTWLTLLLFACWCSQRLLFFTSWPLSGMPTQSLVRTMIVPLHYLISFNWRLAYPISASSPAAWSTWLPKVLIIIISSSSSAWSPLENHKQGLNLWQKLPRFMGSHINLHFQRWRAERNTHNVDDLNSSNCCRSHGTHFAADD